MHSTADKIKIRKWLHRPKDKKPGPDPKQLRRELGFELIEQARDKRFRY